MSMQTGSLAGGNVPFDLNSQAGVMQLLASIRASELTSSQKNELRDLVFLYSNGGGDVSVRIALLQKLETYKIAPVIVGKKTGGQSTALPQVVRPFGASRPAPAFSSVTTKIPLKAVAPALTRAPMLTAVVVEQPPSAPIPPLTPPPVVVPPAVKIENSVVVPPTPTVEAPVLQEAVIEPLPSFLPDPVLVPAPTTVVPVAVSSATHLERIRYIKQVVNQKVGNPVNLVDIDNNVGREYMMSLLEAMKKVGGGIPGELDVAMLRLEAAFLQVEKTVAEHQSELHMKAVRPLPTAKPVVSASASPLSSEPVAKVPQPTKPQAEPPLTRPSEPIVDRWQVETLLANPPAQFRAASLADDADRLLTPSDLPDPATLSTGSAAQAGDSLHTKEVDTGLDQLLLEWDIFKKSGLFGTGPKGIVHPLFKVLAPLTIPLILAGRYDGATQEIRQSVTDYMNGWRYEQGLVYDQEETFEKYLRRVIRHIIDLQKRRGSA